jgi:hypothetical protein
LRVSSGPKRGIKIAGIGLIIPKKALRAIKAFGV